MLDRMEQIVGVGVGKTGTVVVAVVKTGSVVVAVAKTDFEIALVHFDKDSGNY